MYRAIKKLSLYYKASSVGLSVHNFVVGRQLVSSLRQTLIVPR